MITISRHSWGARQPRPMDKQTLARELFLHHSDDTDAASLVTLSDIKAKARQIQGFHMVTRGWSDIAYHYLVFQPYGPMKQPVVCRGRNPFNVPAAQLNHNTNTIAVCVVGNFDHDEVKPGTLQAIREIIRRHPNVRKIGGHRDVVSTDCPGKHLYSEIPALANSVKLAHF